MQDFPGPPFQAEAGQLIPLRWTRIQPCREVKVTLPTPPGTEVLQLGPASAKGLTLRDRRRGSGVYERRVQELVDPQGRLISRASVNAPWQAYQFDALHRAVEQVLERHSFPTAINPEHGILAGWTGADLIWTEHPGQLGYVVSEDWELSELGSEIYSLQDADGALLWTTDSAFFWAHMLWPSVAAVVGNEVYLRSCGITPEVIANFREASFDVGAMTSRHTFYRRFDKPVVREEKMQSGRKRGGSTRGKKLADDKEAWSVPFSKFLPQIVDQEEGRGRVISQSRLADIAEENWPKGGFAGQLACPEHSTLVTTISKLEKTLKRGEPLLRRARVPRGRKGQAVRA